jgi:hypothetical protein
MLDNSLLLDEAHRRCTFNYALHTLNSLKVKPIPTGRHLVEINFPRELSICLKEVKEATTCEPATDQISNQPQQSVHQLRMCVSAQGLVATKMQS